MMRIADVLADHKEIKDAISLGNDLVASSACVLDVGDDELKDELEVHIEEQKKEEEENERARSEEKCKTQEKERPRVAVGGRGIQGEGGSGVSEAGRGRGSTEVGGRAHRARDRSSK